MECPKCYLKYRIDSLKIPRILTNCGHSFCEVRNIKKLNSISFN